MVKNGPKSTGVRVSAEVDLAEILRRAGAPGSLGAAEDAETRRHAIRAALAVLYPRGPGNSRGPLPVNPEHLSLAWRWALLLPRLTRELAAIRVWNVYERWEPGHRSRDEREREIAAAVQSLKRWRRHLLELASRLENAPWTPLAHFQPLRELPPSLEDERHDQLRRLRENEKAYASMKPRLRALRAQVRSSSPDSTVRLEDLGEAALTDPDVRTIADGWADRHASEPHESATGQRADDLIIACVAAYGQRDPKVRQFTPTPADDEELLERVDLMCADQVARVEHRPADERARRAIRLALTDAPALCAAARQLRGDDWQTLVRERVAYALQAPC